jgi:hypothetical protein
MVDPFDFSESAFRLEQFQDYSGVTVTDTDLEEWADYVARSRAVGKRIYRVRIVEFPLTEYTKWELDAYARTDEEVYVTDRASDPALAGLRVDWWGFDIDTDHPRVWRLIYDEQAGFQGKEEFTAATNVDACRRERDLALKHAVALADFTTLFRTA